MAGETPQLKLARDRGIINLHDDEIVFDTDGIPLAQIYCSAFELIPTMEYGNVTCGPVIIKRYVKDDENLRKEIVKTQEYCEKALAEDRKTVYALIRQVIR
jgi:hypothetical protein